MARNFRELEAKMPPGARARSDAKTGKMIEEMALNELRQVTDNEKPGQPARRTDVYLGQGRACVSELTLWTQAARS